MELREKVLENNKNSEKTQGKVKRNAAGNAALGLSTSAYNDNHNNQIFRNNLLSLETNQLQAETYLGPCKTSMMELFYEIS